MYQKLGQRPSDDGADVQSQVLLKLVLRRPLESFEDGVVLSIHLLQVMVHVFNHHDVVVELLLVLGIHALDGRDWRLFRDRLERFKHCLVDLCVPLVDHLAHVELFVILAAGSAVRYLLLDLGREPLEPTSVRINDAKSMPLTGNTRMNPITPLLFLILTLVSSIALICSSRNRAKSPERRSCSFWSSLNKNSWSVSSSCTIFCSTAYMMPTPWMASVCVAQSTMFWRSCSKNENRSPQ